MSCLRLQSLLSQFPDLVNDVSTGGAQPLHMAGMSGRNQGSVHSLVEHGADIEAMDTYGFTPLLRISAANRSIGSTTGCTCTITEKAPTRAFSWLKAATTAFTFKTLLRHYAKRALTAQSLT